jgi:cytochrome c-type biogenesis protein CcmH/NrfG
MSPDSAETRLRILESDVSALKQQVSDTVDDVRVFAPLIAAQAETRATMAHFGTDLAAIQRQLGDLERRLADETRQRKEQYETDRREREQGQAERQKQESSNRTLLWAAVIAAFSTVILGILGVVASVIA